MHPRLPLILSTFLSIAAPVCAQGVTAEIVASSLSSPTDLASPPGDARLFVVQLTGQVRVIENGVLLPVPYLDVSGVIHGGAFTGLRGFTFHPDYASNGHVYLWYEAPAGAQPDIVMDRMTVSAGDRNVADPGSRVEILRFSQPQQWHGGGDMAFGSDGYLYCGTGDGYGLGMDAGCHGQDGGVLMGKILRLDVDSAFPYAIPPDNPFVGEPSVLDEIWHLGLRHPWRWSFDRATGDMYIADVGESTTEEVDFAPAGVGGLNFGWKVMEGSGCYNETGCTNVEPCHSPEYTLPIHEFPHTAGCSIIGGFVYRGSAIPSLYGHYLFGDWCTGKIWSLRYSGGTVQDLQERTSELGGPFGGLVSFGEDAAGELYFMDDDTLYKLVNEGELGTYVCSPNNPNSTGLSGHIIVQGSTSAGADDLTLTAVSLPTDPNIGYFLRGLGQNQFVPPGAGSFFCIAPQFARYLPPVLNTSPNGSFTLSPGTAGINAGETWGFQAWHRDFSAGVSHFTDAARVTFAP